MNVFGRFRRWRYLRRVAKHQRRMRAKKVVVLPRPEAERQPDYRDFLSQFKAHKN